MIKALKVNEAMCWIY